MNFGMQYTDTTESGIGLVEWPSFDLDDEWFKCRPVNDETEKYDIKKIAQDILDAVFDEERRKVGCPSGKEPDC